ncbi:hypothetical protein WH47_11556 [Habropoda laboriosa]|uniref:Uncharacterized protein n=1 Tax=Habropoda laboriosa TaxID=597456 RepID=A0A0L7QLS3_9HYME|nr:hypothetical protein WH47_11556 [Habropoda laboriosa]
MESGAHQGNAAGIILRPSTFPMPRVESSGPALGKDRTSAVEVSINTAKLTVPYSGRSVYQRNHLDGVIFVDSAQLVEDCGRKVEIALLEIILFCRVNGGRRGDVDEGGAHGRRIRRDREKMGKVEGKKKGREGSAYVQDEALNPLDDNRFALLTPVGSPIPRREQCTYSRKFATSIVYGCTNNRVHAWIANIPTVDQIQHSRPYPYIVCWPFQVSSPQPSISRVDWRAAKKGEPEISVDEIAALTAPRDSAFKRERRDEARVAEQVDEGGKAESIAKKRRDRERLGG